MGRPQSVAGGRPHKVTIRLSEAELRHLKAVAGGMSPADFFRGLLNGSTPPYKSDARLTSGFQHAPDIPSA